MKYWKERMLVLCAALTTLSANMMLAAEDDAAGFREICAKKYKEGQGMAVQGRDGWLFLRNELRHISVGPFWGEAAAKVSKAKSAKKADPLPAILDFNKQLKALNIQLILAPVPCKALIYPEALGKPATQRLDAQHQQFFKLLRKEGVKVLDLTDLFLKEKAKPDTPLLYCKTDTHWSPYACEVVAKQIKQMLGSPEWLKGDKDAFAAKTEKRKIVGDLTGGKGSEELLVRRVEATKGALQDKASPILLLGDSHMLVFHAGGDLHGTGAGLADQLALEIGMAVDVIGVRGSGATPARINLMRRAKANPQYLPGKKVIIWCFAAREFTESTGWLVFKLKR